MLYLLQMELLKRICITIIKRFGRETNIDIDFLDVSSFEFELFYTRVSIYYSGITKEIPSECVESILLPQLKALYENTNLPKEMCKIIMLYLHATNWKSDNVLSTFVSQNL